MKKNDFQRIMEMLSFVLRCPVCSYKYNLERTKIIETKEEGQNEAAILVHSDCAQCKSSVVFSIIISGPEIFSVGMITDLTGSDTAKFSNAQPLSADEVLEMHNFVRAFDGDLVKVLS